MVHAPTLVTLLAVLTVSQMCDTKMLRNKALLSQMISNFQRPRKSRLEPAITTSTTVLPDNSPPDSIVTLMLTLLCKKFPEVPCDVIERDDKLRSLIRLSVRKIQEQITETVSVPPPQLDNTSSKVSHARTHRGRKNKKKMYNSGRKMSKFFPHKVKSVRPQPEWKIDYNRHGEPAQPDTRLDRLRTRYIRHVHTAPQEHS